MIRPATIHDVDEAERIYDEVLDYEAEHGTTTNWVKGKYPTRKTAEKALAAGTYYVGEDENGNIFGTVNLNHVQPAEYANIPRASYHFHCLQYTDRGTVPGIEGKVDLDLLILP